MKKKQDSDMSAEEVARTLMDHKEFFGMCFSPDEMFKKWVINLPDILLQMNIDALDFDAIYEIIPESERKAMVKFSEIFSGTDQVNLAQFLEIITPGLLSILQQNVLPAVAVADQWKNMIEVHDLLVGYNNFFKEGQLNPLKLERWLNRQDNQHFRESIDNLELVMNNYLFQCEEATRKLYLKAIQSDTGIWIDFLIESPVLISSLKVALLGAKTVMKKWEDEQMQRHIEESADKTQSIRSLARDRRSVVNQIQKTHHYSESMIVNLVNLKNLYPKGENSNVNFEKFVRLFYFKEMPESKLLEIRVIYDFLENSRNMNEEDFFLAAKKFIQAEDTGSLHKIIADVNLSAQHYSELLKQLTSVSRNPTFFTAEKTLKSETNEELDRIEKTHPQIFSGAEGKAFISKDSGKYFYFDTNAIFSKAGRLSAEMTIDKSLTIFRFQLIFAFIGALRHDKMLMEYLSDTKLYEIVSTNRPRSLKDLNSYININEAYTALSEEFTLRLSELKLLKTLLRNQVFLNLFPQEILRTFDDQLSKLPDSLEVNNDAHYAIDNYIAIIRIYHHVLPAIHLENYSVANEVRAMITVLKHDNEKSEHDQLLIQTYLREEVDQNINNLHDLLRVHQLHRLLLNSDAIMKLNGDQSVIRRQSEIIQLLSAENKTESSQPGQFNTDITPKDIEYERQVQDNEDRLLSALSKALNSVGKEDYDPVFYADTINYLDSYLAMLMEGNNEEIILEFTSKLNRVYDDGPLELAHSGPLGWTESPHPVADKKGENSSGMADSGNDTDDSSNSSIPSGNFKSSK